MLKVYYKQLNKYEIYYKHYENNSVFDSNH